MSSYPLFECFFIIVVFVLTIDITKVYTKNKLLINTIKEEFKFIFLSTFIYLTFVLLYIYTYQNDIFNRIFSVNEHNQDFAQICLSILLSCVITITVNSLLYLGVIIQWFYVS